MFLLPLKASTLFCLASSSAFFLHPEVDIVNILAHLRRRITVYQRAREDTMARCFLTPCTTIQVTLYIGSPAEGDEGIKTLSFSNEANKLQVKTQQPFASRKIWIIMNPSFKKTED